MTPVEASDRRRSFCARLKSERERRGTSLATIAESTKIKASLLDALERGDLSRWPKGLYRRAFFREYVAAIGLPLEPTVSDFVELFADGEPLRTPVAASAAPKGPETLRLLLGPASPQIVRRRATHDLAIRLTFAVTDVCAALLLAWIVRLVSPLAMTQTALLLGVLAYLAAAVLGESPSLWVFTRVRRLRPVPNASVPSPVAPLPFHVDASSSPVLTFSDRFAEALGNGRTLVQDCVEGLSLSELTAGRQRRSDLASLRRQRAEAASRATADELVI